MRDTATKLQTLEIEKAPNEYRIILTELRQNRLAMFGLIVLVALMTTAIAAPLLAPHDPYQMDLENRAAAPSRNNWLGTDEFGRDILSRMIFGSRVSLSVGLISIAMASAVGVPLGLVSGFYGGLVDNVLMRITDSLMAFPPILLAVALMAAFGPGTSNVILALAIVYTPEFSRVIRSSALSVKEELYIMAAKSVGIADSRIIYRHVLPNVIAPFIVQATIDFAFAVLSEASLSFLGLGVMPPEPSWGLMIGVGRDYLETAPWMSVFPGLAISLTVLAINFLGDGLREAMDPFVRRRS